MRALTPNELTELTAATAIKFPNCNLSTIVAVALDNTGAIQDACYCWQTAQSLASHSGLRLIAIADDNSRVLTSGEPCMTREQIQDLCDRETELHSDCFGIPEPFDPRDQPVASEAL
jgi:hypothetical protein